MATAKQLPAEKQSTFLDRVFGELQRRQFGSTANAADGDITEAIERALRGLQYSANTFP
jgi:hypothetical protein